jgi:ribosomal protein L31
MAKPDIHPQWYPDAKVYCNGQVVMTIGSTKPELHVDVWSGNHPFYTGTQKIIVCPALKLATIIKSSWLAVAVDSVAWRKPWTTLHNRAGSVVI